MIKVDISKDKIVLEGHALFADFGKDIVCSAVSSIVTTSINAILSFDNKFITYELLKDKLEIEVVTHNNIVDTLIDNMINMLKEVENDFPKNIKIRKEN